MKKETKTFLAVGIGTAFAAFLTALIPTFRELAQDNMNFLIGLAVINGLKSAVNVFLERFKKYQNTKDKVKAAFTPTEK